MRNANEILRALATLENEDAELGFLPTVLRNGHFKTAWTKAVADLKNKDDTLKLATYVLRKIIKGDGTETQFELFVRAKGSVGAAEEIVRHLAKAYFGDAGRREDTLLKKLAHLSLAEAKTPTALKYIIDDIVTNYESTVGNSISDQRLQDALVAAMEFPRCSRRISHLAAEVSKAKNYEAAIKVLIDEDAERETSRRPLRYDLTEAELREAGATPLDAPVCLATADTRSNDKAHARVAGERPATGRRDPDAPCELHSKPGREASHTNAQCHVQNGTATTSSGKSKCFGCGATDHLKRDCPHLQPRTRRGPRTPPRPAPRPTRSRSPRRSDSHRTTCGLRPTSSSRSTTTTSAQLSTRPPT